MQQALALISLLVRDYDEAIAFFTGTLGFSLQEDTSIPAQNKRWVVVAPPGRGGTRLLLARASTPEQIKCIGNQTGGRVFLFLHTDDFARDYRDFAAAGVTFVRAPREESWGTVAVFRDLYGNLWDLVQPKITAPDRPS
jgi:catechol 2,3-dioxygenase-like lactoylglutathione lyase family enzyme